MEDERDEELSSITAIFPELLLDPDDSHSATLDLEVAPTEPVAAQFRPIETLHAMIAHGQGGELRELEDAQVFHLLYLPNIKVRITLPNGYPDESPPKFSISTNPKWLSKETINSLIERGTALWEEYGRSQVVYAFIDMLQQEAEQAFGCVQTGLELDISHKEHMVEYSKSLWRQKFEQGTYECGICLEPKRGTVCYKLRGCGHVFCRECLQDFYNAAITEGDVASVKCLAPDCGTEGATIQAKRKAKKKALQPGELLDIPLERDQVKRYLDIKVKKILESDQNVIYCPRTWCQAPARTPRYARMMASAQNLTDFPESDDESTDGDPDVSGDSPKNEVNGERLAICSACTFAFCSRCERSWHGDFLACRPQAREKEMSEDEKATFDYIRTHTSACPTCAAPCQKTMGCNHMRCFQCGTHFCYLCGAWLKPENPYEHFNTQGQECYMRLWELEEGDEGGLANQGVFAGARALEMAEWEAAEAVVDAADAPPIINGRVLGDEVIPMARIPGNRRQPNPNQVT